jgi:NDP-hexose 4-ketoreductase
VEVIGRGFLALNLIDSFGRRHPDVTALAAGVSSTSVTAPADLDREASLLYRTLAACRARRRTLVFFSTASFAMYGSSTVPLRESDPICPPSVYGRHKLALESCVQSSGVDFLILRVSHLVGRHQRAHQVVPALARQVRTGTVTIYQGAFRDLLDMADLMVAIGALLDRRVRGQVVNVVSGVPQPVDRIVDGIEHRLGTIARRIPVPGAPVRTLVCAERLRQLAPGIGLCRPGPDYLDYLLDSYLPTIDPVGSVR